MRAALVVLAALSALLASPARATPSPMTRTEILNLAKGAVGYSYWWGGGCWRSDGTQHGSCSGSCPSCTHTGSYGADCSGYAAKVWQVPSPSPITTNAHPYSTYHFRFNETHWKQVTRSTMKPADCMVYRNDANTGGHIVVYESGDPWGSLWLYEARGCSYGIVHNLRPLGSAYITIRRNSLVEGPATGRLRGVVFVDRGQGTADMTERIPGATVSADGKSTTASAGDASWALDVATGDQRVQASASGFTTASRTCTVTAGADTWCSIGLAPACAPSCSGKACGPDGCGGSCGTCASGTTCQSGACVCVPACSGKACGPDGCGGSCGTCASGTTCQSGACVCEPQCAGLACGGDGCGGSCGTCPAGESCSGQGQCVPDCVPQCGERVCGAEPVCGASCGTCAEGEVCNVFGRCAPEVCVAACDDRACGPDALCGTSCGRCEQDAFCELEGACVPLAPGVGKLFGRVLRDGHGGEPGEPLPGARVEIEDGAAMETDEEGRYEAQLTPGVYWVLGRALGFGYGERACEVHDGRGTECDVVLESSSPPDKREVAAQGGCASAGAGGTGGSGSGAGNTGAGGAGLVLLALWWSGRRRAAR